MPYAYFKYNNTYYLEQVILNFVIKIRENDGMIIKQASAQRTELNFRENDS